MMLDCNRMMVVDKKVITNLKYIFERKQWLLLVDGKWGILWQTPFAPHPTSPYLLIPNICSILCFNICYTSSVPVTAVCPTSQHQLHIQSLFLFNPLPPFPQNLVFFPANNRDNGFYKGKKKILASGPRHRLWLSNLILLGQLNSFWLVIDLG